MAQKYLASLDPHDSNYLFSHVSFVVSLETIKNILFNLNFD